MTPVTIAQLRTTATVDLMTAARVLGLGRTKAYDLARQQQFPCPVLRIGEPTVSPPLACSSSSASRPTGQTQALPTSEADNGDLWGTLIATKPGPLKVRPPAAAAGQQPPGGHSAPVAERRSGPR